MENKYASALNELGLDRFVSLAPGTNREELLLDYIIKGIFYSKDEDAHNKSSAQLLAESGFVIREDLFTDLTQLSRVYKINKMLNGLMDRHVTSQDIIDIRLALEDGLFSNGKTYHGFRRYRISNSLIISIPQEQVREEMEKVTGLLNKRFESTAAAFVNAVEFYAASIKLHPFEDANGRPTRVLYNFYAIENGIRPIHISDSTLSARDYKFPFIISGYLGSTVASTLILSLDKKSREELRQLIEGAGMPESPYALDIKCNLALLLDKEHDSYASGEKRMEMWNNIKALFGDGERTGDHDLMYSAMGLLSAAKIDDGLLIGKAMFSGDAKLRSMAVFAMCRIDIQKYQRELEAVILDKNENEGVRMIAIILLCEKGMLTLKKINEAAMGETNETVLITLGKYHYRGISDNASLEELMMLPDKLINSGSTEQRLRGYQALISHPDVNAMMERMMPAFKSADPDADLIKKELIVRLNNFGKLNDAAVATELSALAASDIQIRRPLLGELIKPSTDVNPVYFDLLENIIKSSDASESEKAHAIYALSKAKGDGTLKNYLRDSNMASGNIVGEVSGLLSIFEHGNARQLTDEDVVNYLSNCSHKRLALIALALPEIASDIRALEPNVLTESFDKANKSSFLADALRLLKGTLRKGDGAHRIRAV